MTRPNFPARPAIFLFVTGFVVAVYAALALVARFDMNWAQALESVASRMPPHVALGLLLGGASLMSCTFRARILSIALAVAVIVLGGVHLVEFGAGWQLPAALSVGSLFADTAGDAASISLLTALNLVLIGTMVAVLAAAREQLASDVIVALAASAVLAISLVSLFAHVSGSRFVYDSLRFSGAELEISIAFIALGLSLTIYIFSGAERIELRKWAPIPLWFGVFICTLLLWQALRVQEAGDAQQAVARTAAAMRGDVAEHVQARTETLRRFAARWQIYQPSEAQWRTEANQYVKYLSDLTALYWADDDLRVQWAEPASGDESGDKAASGLILSDDPAHRAALDSALAHRDVAVTGSIDLAGGGRELHVYAPVYRPGGGNGAAGNPAEATLAGVVVGVFRLQPLLDGLLKNQFPGFAATLKQGDQIIYDPSGPGEKLARSWAVTETIPLSQGGDSAWQLTVTPTHETVRQTQSSIPEAALASGIGLASLLAFMAFLLQTAWRRSRQLSISNQALAYEVRQRVAVERAAREAEQRSRLISSVVRDYAIYTLSTDGLITSWNEGAQLTKGYAAEDILGKHFSIFFTEEQIERSLPERSLQLAATQGRYEDEDLRVTADGGEFCADEVITPMRDEQGQLQGFSVITRDVTERKNVEQKIRESRDFYMKLIGDFPNPVRRSDASGRCDYFNRAWLDFTGRSLEQELGDGWLEGVHPDDRERCMQAHGEVLTERTGFEVEYRLRRADGSYGSLLDFSQPFYDQRGRFTGYIGACYDMTERRAAEIALRSSEARYEAMTSNVPGMVFQLETDGASIHFRYVSRKVYQLFRIGPGAVKTDAEALLGLMPPQDRERFTSSLAEAAQHMTEWQWDGRVLPRQRELKEIKWVTVKASPTSLEDSRTLWDGVLFDDTARRRAQLEVEHSREQLRALSHHLQAVREEEKSHLAREIHDELGGTLTALKMDIAWLIPRLTPAQGLLVERIRGMSQLVDSAVYAMRRISSELRPTLLDDLGLVAALQWQAAEYQKRTGTTCSVDAEPEDSVVPNELAVAFFRVFQEALTNVTRHAKASHVIVTWRERADGYLLQIADDGVGFSEGHRIKPTSNGIRGMTERARHLFGNVSVASAPGKGTTVTVSLPKASQDEEARSSATG
ncbi:MAG: PAS domain S-box protein [Burkholderiales bacterium]|nr:PAS domain S-box protein [Burkholderiales bacterium]